MLKCLNPYDYDDFTNRGAEFRYRTIFERAVRLGVVEFQDIVRFETTEQKTKYDDMAEFCSERYNDSLALCKKYLTDVIEANFDAFTSVIKFEAKYIVPSDDYVKLNNLKKYIENANLSTGDYTAPFWNKHSTTAYI